MLDIMRSNRCYDLVYAYKFGNARVLRDALVADSNVIASSIASIKDAVKAAYETEYKQVAIGSR